MTNPARWRTSPRRSALQNRPLLGRAELVERGLELFRAGTRLVTLTGPGGIGKTRVAAEIAELLQSEFDDEVWWVDLTRAASAGDVPSEIAGAIGLSQIGEQALVDSLVEQLGDDRLLLVLDNMEHVIGAGADVAQMVARCHGLFILITSTVVLHVGWEHQLDVPPLPLVADSTEGSGAETGLAPAVELFLLRGRQVNPQLGRDPSDVVWIERICQRLEGIALAIELAASRSNVLSPALMFAELDNRFSVLAGGPRDLPRRHQTMRGLIAWTYMLLSEQSRRLFQEVCIFTGSFDLDAVMQLSEEMGSESIRNDVLRGLGVLCDHSLVNSERSIVTGGTRFRMLETVRDFARDQALENGLIDRLASSHATVYFAQLEATDTIDGPDRGTVHARIDEDHPNFRQAFEWLMERGDLFRAARWSALMVRYWQHRGLLEDGLNCSTRVVTATDPSKDGPARAWALLAAGSMVALLQANADAYPLLDEAARIFRKPEMYEGLALALPMLAAAVSERFGFDKARPLFEEAILLGRSRDRPRAVARTLSIYGAAAYNHGEVALAQSALLEAASLLRSLGDPAEARLSMVHVARILLDEGDLATARRILDEGVSAMRHLDDSLNLALYLVLLGRVDLAEGDPLTAASGFLEALEIVIRSGAKGRAVPCLDGLSLAIGGLHHSAEAGAIAAAADAVRNDLELGSWSEFMASPLRAEDRPRTPTPLLLMGAPSWPPAEAVEAASRAIADVNSENVQRNRSNSSRRAGFPVGLSPREVEVLRLIATGSSSKEIANTLYISLDTVGRHITNLYRKIGARNRAAATSFALSHDVLA